MKPLPEMILLRRHLAAAQLKSAFRDIRSGRFATATDSLTLVSRLDPTLANPYVMRAKVAFWKGDLVDAEKNIAQAEERGFPNPQCEAMRSAIDELRQRVQAKQRTKADSAAKRAALFDSIYRFASNDANWLTPRLVAMILFLGSIIIMLSCLK